MRILQDAFDKVFAEALSPQKLLLNLIDRKLRDAGISLPASQRRHIAAKLRAQTPDTIQFAVDDKYLPQVTQAFAAQGGKYLLQLEEADAERIVENISDNIAKFLPEAVTETSSLLSQALLKSAGSMLSERRRTTRRFTTSLHRHWGKALDSLAILTVIAFDAGSDLSEDLSAGTAVEKPVLAGLLIRLHSRACQISSEILTLLAAGYADGAHARWRTLHELAAVSMFLAHHNDDLAQRYITHEKVEAYRSAVVYQQHATALGYEPLTQGEMSAVKSEHDALTARYGGSYGEEYGWASEALSKKRPSFRDIEEGAGLAHVRPLYKLASQNVHANPKGAFFRLGLFPNSPDVLLAGPSTAGLADPGHATAITLTQITIALLMLDSPTLDSLVLAQVLLHFADKAGDEFLRAHKALEANLNQPGT